jgi:hypothetical protein
MGLDEVISVILCLLKVKRSSSADWDFKAIIMSLLLSFLRFALMELFFVDSSSWKFLIEIPYE